MFYLYSPTIFELRLAKGDNALDCRGMEKCEKLLKMR
jgi:hypothetical protein